MPVKISVVVATFNRQDTLREVLPTLINQTLPPDQYEILLCDAGSTDGTKEYVESLQAPNVKLLVGPNTGRGGARNRGIAAANGEIVMFTDADILADPNLLAEHLRFHEKYPGQAVVGCEVQVKTLDEYQEFRQDPQAHARHKATRRLLPWHYFLTGNASAPKALLLEVGCFDESFTGYGHEDLELGYRLIKRGIPIHYNPQAIDYHWHPVEFAEQINKMRLAGRSTVRFYRKHKDLRICLQMGMNPISLTVHAMVSEKGWLLTYLTKMAQHCPLAKEFVLQYHYVTGIKEALRQ